MNPESITNNLFHPQTETEFTELALQVFRFQYENCAVYKEYINTIGIDVSAISKLKEIPFLPIAFFKSHKVVCGGDNSYEQVFESSTTTGAIPSKHFVKHINLYEQSFRKGFELFYGDIREYCILALLPSYLERGNSSLVYMANDLIKSSNKPDSGFYMNNYEELAQKLKQNEERARPDEPFGRGQKTLLLGVTYALLDLAISYQPRPNGSAGRALAISHPLKNAIIMETGGMKGRREELTKPEIHKLLTDAFKIDNVHSEYGMTELLSQAYSKGKGLFQCVPWMKVLIRDIYDPFMVGAIQESPVKGAINIIDLANIYSCSFIATDDLGILHPNGEFEVAGRLDYSDIRGCNLMASEL